MTNSIGPTADGCEMTTNHVRFALAPRRFHLVTGHGSRGATLESGSPGFSVNGGSRRILPSCDRHVCGAKKSNGPLYQRAVETDKNQLSLFETGVSLRDRLRGLPPLPNPWLLSP